jgi:hypothetical protein
MTGRLRKEQRGPAAAQYAVADLGHLKLRRDGLGYPLKLPNYL